MKAQPASVYDDSHSRKRQLRSPVIFLGQLGLMIILLLGIRFANTAFLWHINKQEILHNTISKGENIRFLGFSLYASAKKNFLTEAKLNPHGTQIHCFFTPFHPVVFLINKQDNRTFLELGRFDTVLKNGLSEITIFTSDIVTFKHGEKAIHKFIGHCLLKSMFAAITATLNQKDGGGPPFSFMLKPIEKTKYLKTPYMVYFFLPLIIILALNQRYGMASLFAFIYYLEAFFLFDTRTFFVVGPFSWLFKLLGIQLSAILTILVSIICVITFLLFTLKGATHLRGGGKSRWERFYILLFIFLPIFLRF